VVLAPVPLVLQLVPLPLVLVVYLLVQEPRSRQLPHRHQLFLMFQEQLPLVLEQPLQ
jgi:hypothetical protein